MNRKTKVIQFLAVVLIGFPLCAYADQKLITSGSNDVSFVAKITASSFVAKSTAATGYVVLDDAGKKIMSAEITVPVKSLDTGISMRNGHMQDKYLEAEKFPNIVFSLKMPIDFQNGDVNQVTGEFIIKGVTKSTIVQATIKQPSSTKLQVSCDFPINITDYGIEQPKFAVVKMETGVKVHTDLNFERKP